MYISHQSKFVREFQFRAGRLDYNLKPSLSCCRNRNSNLQANVQVDYPLGHLPQGFDPATENGQAVCDEVMAEWDQHICMDDFFSDDT